MKQNHYNVRVQGDLACFALPYGPERTSSLIPSHDAAVNILKSVYGTREVTYEIEEIRLLTAPTRISMTLNEVYKQTINPWRVPSGVSAQNNRTQRTTTFLKDPDYIIKARPVLSGQGTHDTNNAKIHEIFKRKLLKGKHHKQPYLGMRECTAYLELVEDVPDAVDLNVDLGIHYYGFDFESRIPYFTPLCIEHGIVKYPTWDEVKVSGMRGIAR